MSKQSTFTRERIITSILGILLLIASVSIYKKLSTSKKEQPSKVSNNVTNVVLETVKSLDTIIQIQSNGTLVAKNQIDIVSRVSGIFINSVHPFRAGVNFKKGETLIELDNQDFYAKIKTSRSQLLQSITGIMADIKFDYPESYDTWKQYLVDFNIDQSTKALPVSHSQREKAFIQAKNILPQYYNIKALEITNGYYRITAPFNGIVSKSMINKGALVSPGMKLGSFINPYRFEMEIKISPSELKWISVGKVVKLNDTENTQQWTGKITRINKVIDPQSQSVLATVELGGKGLVDGMFLQAHVNSKKLENVVPINRILLFDDRYVYMQEDTILRKVEVETIYKSESTVFVKGLKEGSRVLGKYVPSVYDGMHINDISQKQGE